MWRTEIYNYPSRRVASPGVTRTEFRNRKARQQVCDGVRNTTCASEATAKVQAPPTMPRKGAPQPLALNTAVSANSPPASLPQTQTQTQTQTQMQAQARDRQASLATETSPLGVSPGTSLSPPDSRSSRSPRSSPFSSKFAPRRPHTSRGALQSTTSQPQSANPSPIRADHETAYLPIEAALHQEQQDPQTTPVQAVPPDSAPLRHVQTEGVNAKKSTKSGFFGLGNKVTKAAHSQFHVSYQPESRGRMDSREAAETGSSKHEGMSLNLKG